MMSSSILQKRIRISSRLQISLKLLNELSSRNEEKSSQIKKHPHFQEKVLGAVSEEVLDLDKIKV